MTAAIQPRLWSYTMRALSAFALVLAVSGISTAAAQANSLPAGAAGTETSAVRFIGQANRLDLMQNDMSDEGEEAEEEFEEDGLLPTGQAEQRAQAIGDKTEARDEDHDN